MDKVGEALAALHDIRPPDLGAAQLYGDALTAFAIGIFLAMAIAAIIRFFTYRPVPARATLLEELSRSRHLPRGERILEQAKLARRLGTLDIPGLSGALYRHDSSFDVEAADQKLTSLIAAHRGMQAR
jgi:hypothetical protein